MNFSRIMDLAYEDSLPLFYQIQVWLHSFFCPCCAKKIENLETAKNIMRHDFFISLPDTEKSLENPIMEKIAFEDEIEPYAIPAGLSTRLWVIAGLVIILSLATAFFGFDFQKIAQETGSSFLLPVGITVGIVLTSYCVFFIGSHLKELTERFGL